MVKKVRLFKFITSGKRTHREWLQFLPEVTGLRVKGVGSKGDVLISLDDSGWFNPIDWAANYKATIREQVVRELSRAEGIFSPEEIAEILERCHMSYQTSSVINTEDYDHMIGVCSNEAYTSGQRAFSCLAYLLKAKFDDFELVSQLNEIIKDNPHHT